MVNPYYVQPVDIGSQLQGLAGQVQGLGQVMQQKRQFDREEKLREEARQELNMAVGEFETAMVNKDYDAINRLSIKYPQIGKNVMSALGADDERKKNNIIDTGFQLLQRPQDFEQIIADNPIFAEQVGGAEAAIKRYRENPEIVDDEAKTILAMTGGDRWKAYREYEKSLTDTSEVKQTQQQKNWGTYQELLQTDPAQAEAFGRASGFISSDGKVTEPTKTATRKDWETYQELKKTAPQDAEEFGRKAGFVSKEGMELSPTLQKRLSVATDEAIESERSANSAETLANDFERMNVSGGLITGKWGESLKDITGTQDAITELRKKYNAVRSSQAVKNLPPGVASDKDIELALSGFPSENANAQQVASFMRGVAKMERERAKYASFRADYISENGTERGMLKEWKESTKKPQIETVSWNDL